MNQPLPTTLQADVFAQAQMLAQQQQRRVIEVLEELLSLDSEALVNQLGHLLHYPVATMREMREWQVAFDVISYNTAQQKECLAFHDENHALILIFADPFDKQLPLWAQHAVQQTFTWRLAHRLDISAYLAGEEETMRAMDGMGLHEDQAQEGEEEVVMQLSLKSIHEDANPIIKLINSTLYDALKTGASDIHLESHPGGLAVKYRIDGVMASIANSPGLDSAE
ncbi:MAG: type II/IV secretion system protein, partial [Methylophilus sp.]